MSKSNQDFYFPLYENLDSRVKTNKKMTISAVEKLGRSIEEINMSDDQAAKELIYVLIITHAIKNNIPINFIDKKLPYNGTLDEDNSATWKNIHDFPDKLLFIIETFISTHEKAGLTKDFDP